MKKAANNVPLQKSSGKILHILKKMLGIFFLASALGGIIFIIECLLDNDEVSSILASAFLIILLLFLSYLCFRNKKPKSNNINNAKSLYGDKPYSENSFSENINGTEYVETKSGISDEEVPYFMLQGYIDALNAEKTSSNPKFHRTQQEKNLADHFSEKYYYELSARAARFEDLYRASYYEKDISKKILLLENALNEFENCKKFCYSKGKGGTIYFQDMYEYLHNAHNECFSYRDMISETLEKYYYERDELIPVIKYVISQHDGILQKNIYPELPDFERGEIQRILRKLDSDGVITRIKKSGTYELHINN